MAFRLADRATATAFGEFRASCRLKSPILSVSLDTSW